MTTHPLLQHSGVVYDYQLIIRPPERVRARLDQVRQRLQEQLLPFSQWAPGKNHVPVASFSQYAQLESKLTDRLQEIASQVPPFVMQIENYGALLHHTVHFRLLESAGFAQLLQYLRREQTALQVMHQSARLASLPKINVAYKLGPTDFENAWHYFKSKKLHLHFVADGMLLLRRRHASEKWQIIRRLGFENQPALQQQGVLFAA
jgi:2'-5' RNA ligase